MYLYKVTFGNGSQMNIRASSPKEAFERASKVFQIVAHIKFLK